jgi:hypothetical protein
MIEFLQTLLKEIVDITMTSQEFHRNVKWDFYFCLHNSFKEDYDEFFEFQDLVWELIVKKWWTPNLSMSHDTHSTSDYLDIVSYQIEQLDKIRTLLFDKLKDWDFYDQGVLSPIIDYCDLKLMKYRSFSK